MGVSGYHTFKLVAHEQCVVLDNGEQWQEGENKNCGRKNRKEQAEGYGVCPHGQIVFGNLLNQEIHCIVQRNTGKTRRTIPSGPGQYPPHERDIKKNLLDICVPAYQK
jgi:hypothetical protein